MGVSAIFDEFKTNLLAFKKLSKKRSKSPI